MPIYIGLMSGTSMDALDLALVEIDQSSCQVLDYQQFDFPVSLHQSLQNCQSDFSPPVRQVMELDQQLGCFFGHSIKQFIQQSEYQASDIEAIGSHGQTLIHSPSSEAAFSLQIGNANRIAEITGITTVADFRSMDIAAGGQGAPLVPAFHRAIFSNPGETRVILNIGGIANITVLSGRQVIGFDTGPGNCLMDEWCRQHQQRPFDENGDWAANGQVNQKLLEALLSDPYFKISPPRSTGREYFNLSWLMSFPDVMQIEPIDIQATLLELTAVTICSDTVESVAALDRLIICGGGVHNRALMTALTDKLHPVSVERTDDHGIPADQVEATAFAWLAHRRLSQQTGSLASVTGARHDCVLGAVYSAID